MIVQYPMLILQAFSNQSSLTSAAKETIKNNNNKGANANTNANTNANANANANDICLKRTQVIQSDSCVPPLNTAAAAAAFLWPFIQVHTMIVLIQADPYVHEHIYVYV